MYGIPHPAPLCGRRRSSAGFSPSSDIHKDNVEACRQRDTGTVAMTSLCTIWNQCLPYTRKCVLCDSRGSSVAFCENLSGRPSVTILGYVEEHTAHIHNFVVFVTSFCTPTAAHSFMQSLCSHCFGCNLRLLSFMVSLFFLFFFCL